MIRPALLIVRGDAQAWSLQLYDPDGNPSAGFTGAEPLTATLWRGQSTAAIPGALSAAWVNAPAGQFSLAIGNVASAALGPGTYSVLVEITASGSTRTAYNGVFEVRERPGTLAVPTSYTDYPTMVELYPQLEALSSRVGDQTGFAYQQHQAKADFDLWLVERYNPQPGFARRRSGVFNPSAGFDVPCPDVGLPTVAAIRTALNSGGLFLSEPDSTVVAEINAYMALARVLSRQVGGDRRSNPYAADAAYMLQAAAEMRARYRAFIDLNLDGTPEVLIDRDCIFLS